MRSNKDPREVARRLRAATETAIGHSNELFDNEWLKAGEWIAEFPFPRFGEALESLARAAEEAADILAGPDIARQLARKYLAALIRIGRGKRFDIYAGNPSRWPITIARVALGVYPAGSSEDFDRAIRERLEALTSGEDNAILAVGGPVLKIAEKLGAALRHRRLQMGLSVDELAIKAVVDRADVERIETGEWLGSMGTIGAVADALDYQVDICVRPADHRSS